MSAQCTPVIVAEYNGTVLTTQSGGGFLTVNLPTPVSGNALLRVFDSCSTTVAAPTLSLRKIIINGVANSGATLQVLVANSSVSAFPALPLTDIPAGLVHLGEPGMATDGIEITDPTLRAATILAISVNGNIHGTIECGRVFRIQALNEAGDNLITANITAHAPDATPTIGADPLLGQYAINVITAARGITGNIEATGTRALADNALTHPGSIARIRVGPTFDGTFENGIHGNIIASGHIASIFSTGPVGPNINIWAGGRIEEIRTIDESNPNEVLPRDVIASVRTGTELGRQLTPSPAVSRQLFYSFTGNPSVDAPLGALEVGGNFNLLSEAAGIDVANLAPIPGLGGRSGVRVGKSIGGPIVVRYNLEQSRIVAETIGAIQIGVRMTGSIVEFGRDVVPCKGGNGSISVGFSEQLTLPAGAPPFLGIPNEYILYTQGMTGINCPPVDMSTSDWWKTAPSCTVGAPMGEAFDALIRVGTVQFLRVKTMTLARTTGTSPEFTRYMPRIEAREIGFTAPIGAGGNLIVQSMPAGVIWSGDLNTSSACGLPTTRYAKVFLAASIGCVSPVADVYVNLQGNPTVTATLDIVGDVLGELRMPRVELGTLVTMRGELGNQTTTTTCGCFTGTPPTLPPVCPDQTGTCVYVCPLTPPATSPVEVSPRNFEGGAPYTSTSRIVIEEDLGLQGQVVIEKAWKGPVIVGAGSPSTAITLSPTQSQPNLSPHYSRDSSTLGGGAVGLVPFRLYQNDSSPRDRVFGPNLGVSQALFADPNRQYDPSGFTTSEPPVKARFYGPIRRRVNSPDAGNINSWAAAVRIQCQPLANYGLNCNWFDVTDSFYVVGPGDLGWSDLRSIGLYRKSPTGRIGAGAYRVIFEREQLDVDVFSSRIECDLLRFPTDDVPRIGVVSSAGCQASNQDFIPISYEFRVFPDCDGDTLDDSVNPLTNPNAPECNSGCNADFNRDCVVSVADIFEFLNAWFANQCLHGSPRSVPCTFDPQQPPQFPCYGGSTTDINNNGAIDVADIFDFLNSWFSANCV